MKVRRVTLQVEMPWEFKAASILECLAQGFDEIGYDGEIGIPYKAQIVGDVLSTSTQIGGIK
jgi:hypothetical protein